MIKKGSLNVPVTIVNRAEKVGMGTFTALKHISLKNITFSEALGTYPGGKLERHPVVATKALPEWQQSQFSPPNLVEQRFAGCNLEAGVINQYGIDSSGIVWSNLNPKRRDLPC